MVFGVMVSVLKYLHTYPENVFC